MRTVFNSLVAACALAAAAAVPMQAGAQNQASGLSAVLALPIASVAVSLGAVGGSGAVVAAPLLSAGAVLVVKTVEVTARGAVYVLERVSDGARVSVEITGKGVANVSLAAGTVVTVIVLGTGVILSAAGEAIAFAPNAAGRALLHNERVSN